MAIYLPDVNVWIALSVIEHAHHRQALRWFESTDGHTLAFCRVTQMGFLRLLTNPHVMKNDALTPRAAWQCLDEVYRAIGPILAPEPELLETAWRGTTSSPKAGPNLWMDAYLAAFAQLAGFTFVTFDRGAARHASAAVKIPDS